MDYYEITATAYLKEDIPFDRAGSIIAGLLNMTMLNDPNLKELHEQNKFKHYCFGSFFPIEKEKVYKKGCVYTFKVRTLDLSFAKCVKKHIKSIKNKSMNILAIEATKQQQRYISNVYSVTPVIVTMEENKRWTKEESFLALSDKLKANLEKKYKAFYGENLERDKVELTRIELMNRTPMIVNYKNTRLLGNKFKIWFNEDDISQKLAFVAMACGLGEKNSSIGAGFCMGGQDG